jgi:cytochrome c
LDARFAEMLFARKEPDMQTELQARLPTFAIMTAVFAIFVAPSTASAAGDAAAGKQVLARCAACHSTVSGENKVGPSLAGIFGRKSGSETGYSYSAALKAATITWDERTLDQYLANPAANVPGTKMLVGLPNAADRENIIAYLQTLK